MRGWEVDQSWLGLPTTYGFAIGSSQTHVCSSAVGKVTGLCLHPSHPRPGCPCWRLTKQACILKPAWSVVFWLLVFGVIFLFCFLPTYNLTIKKASPWKLWSSQKYSCLWQVTLKTCLQLSPCVRFQTISTGNAFTSQGIAVNNQISNTTTPSHFEYSSGVGITEIKLAALIQKKEL